MYEGPVAETHHLVQSRDLIFSELMLNKLSSYIWIAFGYHVQVHHYVYPFIFDGEV